MTDLAALGLSVTSTGLVVATDRLEDFQGASDRAARGADNLGRRSDVLSSGLKRLAGIAGGIAGALAGAFSFNAIFQASQQVQGITNGFLGMGQTATQAAASLAEVAGIAERTRAPLEATAELYRRVSVAAADMGATSGEVSRFTENIGLALGAAGTSASQASGALMQLSQAMAGGTVRAEEFNSILEGAFPIAQAAARGIAEAGGSVGKLRQLVVEGKVSSDAFFQAILSQTDQLQTAFANTVPTVAAAMETFRTSFALSSAEIDKALGLSEAAAGAILMMSDAFQFFADSIPALITSMQVLLAILVGLAATQIPLLITSLASATTGVSLMMVQFYAGVAASTALTTATRLLTGAIAALGGPIGLALGAVVSVGSALFLMGRRSDGAGAAVSDLERELGFVPGAASGAATGLGKAGTAAYDAAGKFDDFTGAVGASRTALQLWFDDYMKATALPPITTPLGETINPPGSPESMAEIEGFLGLTGTPNAPTSSPRPPRAPALLGEPRDTGGSSGSSGGSSVEEYTEAQKRALEVISQVNTEAVTQAEVISALEEMHRSGAITADQLATAIGKVKDEMGDVEKVSFSLSDSLAGVFTDALTGAKNLNDGLRDLLKSMSSLFLNAAFKSFLGGIFPSIDFGGFRAGGGGVSAGKSYIVGERGPELFTPGRSGGITPNGAVGGGGTSVQINNYSGAPVREQRSRGPDGREYVKVIVGEELGSGGYDKQLGRYGATPARVKR